MTSHKDLVTPSETAPSKSLTSLVSSLLASDEGNIEAENSTEFVEIYQAIGLTGDDSERINLAKFRRIISENLDVDSSFMYKRVFNAFDRQRNGYVRNVNVKNAYFDTLKQFIMNRRLSCLIRRDFLINALNDFNQIWYTDTREHCVLTAKELVSAISVLLQGPFQSHVELGMRVYGKPSLVDSGEPKQDQTEASVSSSSFTITRTDAILSIVESLQLSSPRARHTLTTDNREKAYHIGEDLVFIIYPKLDIDGDGIISIEDFSRACHEDPSLLQVFGQYLPKNNEVLPSPNKYQGPIQEHVRPLCELEEAVESIRPRSSSSRNSFEGIDYLRYSPTMGTMWGRQSMEGRSLAPRKSERLQPIPMIKPK